jgi:hypothetical protein
MRLVASAQTVVVSLYIVLVALQTNWPGIRLRQSGFINRQVAAMQWANGQAMALLPERLPNRQWSNMS